MDFFELDLTPEILMDVALNAVGYLLAGALSVVVYSLFGRQSKQTEAEPAEVSSQSIPTVPVIRPTEDSAMEFVRFVRNEVEPEPVEQTLMIPEKEELEPFSKIAPIQTLEDEDEVEMPSPERFRKNRATVIRLARQMVADGRPDKDIKDLLPISEAELAMMQVANN